MTASMCWRSAENSSLSMILETAVERARAGCDAVRWQGATRRRAHARKEEQPGLKACQRAAAWPDRVCSAVTHAVMFVVVANVSIHQSSPAEESGQLRFLG